MRHGIYGHKQLFIARIVGLCENSGTMVSPTYKKNPNAARRMVSDFYVSGNVRYVGSAGSAGYFHAILLSLNKDHRPTC